jgi:hypothetical protein
VLLSTPGRIAPARLSIIAGRLRTIRLVEIAAGSKGHAGVALPVMAIADGSRHAYVSGLDGVTADVDLTSLRVRYHPLGELADQPHRAAVLPQHRLALVTYFDVIIVDTQTWRTVGTVTGQHFCWIGSPAIFCSDGNDVDVRDLTGVERFRVHPSAQAIGSQVLGVRAFLSYPQSDRYGVLDLRSGKLTEIRGPLPTVIAGQRGLQPGTTP